MFCLLGVDVCLFGEEEADKCSARISADRAREVLGWKQERGENEFLEEIEDVVVSMCKQED